MSDKTVPDPTLIRDEPLLAAANVDQVMAFAMALAAEVSALHEWRLLVSAALESTGIDLDGLIQEAQARPAVQDRLRQWRSEYVARLLGALTPEQSHVQPIIREPVR